MASDDTVDGADDQSASVDSSVLLRYISGAAGDVEVDRVRRWAAASPHHAGELAELRRAWAAAGEPPETGDVASVWEHVAAAMRRPPGRQRNRVGRADRRREGTPNTECPTSFDCCQCRAAASHRAGA